MSKVFDLIIGAALIYVMYKVLGILGAAADVVTPGKGAKKERETASNAAHTAKIKEALRYFNPAVGYSVVGKKYGGNLNAYYLNKINFSGNKAEAIAKAIRGAHTLFDDDENKLYNSLLEIPSLAALSLVADRYRNVYTIVPGTTKKEPELLPFIASWTSPEEIATVYDIISELPVL